MDFFIAVRILIRRWPIVVATLAAGLGVAYAVMQSVAVTYEATGSVLLYAPTIPEDPDSEPAEVNPFRSFDTSTAVLAAVIVQIMDDGSVRDHVGELGGRPDYQIGQATDGTPVLTVVATDVSPAVAVDTVRLVQQTVNDELERRQAEAGAPEDARIRAIEITAPSDASELVGGRIRAFAAVAAIAIAASLSAAFVAENLAQSRRQRADATVQADSTHEASRNGSAATTPLRAPTNFE